MSHGFIENKVFSAPFFLCDWMVSSSLFERIMRQFDMLIKKKGGSWDPARAPFIQVRSLFTLNMVLTITFCRLHILTTLVLQNYLQQTNLFKSDEDLKDEFDDSRETVASLIQASAFILTATRNFPTLSTRVHLSDSSLITSLQEYQACEGPNYIEWGMQRSSMDLASQGAAGGQ
jgi:hypothetical protein